MKVLLGLSGGFDSAYSARLLMQAGHAVEGAVLDMHCYTAIEEAKRTAEDLGIPLHHIDCHELFESTVITDFCKEYLAARTPNPCIVCNEKVKFRMLYEYAMANGFDRIATGHYARISRVGGRSVLSVARDQSKDQTYMLYRLPQDVLDVLLLPMGDIIKKEAKQTELASSLAAVEREESQEICFVGEEPYADFIERRCGAVPFGDFVSETGKVLGKHRGIIRYTVGQRKGLGVSAASRLFVREIDPESARIILADAPPQVLRFAIKDPVFSGVTRDEALVADDLTVRVRYTAAPVPARIREENGRFWCDLAQPSRSVVASGQSAVFYKGTLLALGGIID